MKHRHVPVASGRFHRPACRFSHSGRCLGGLPISAWSGPRVSAVIVSCVPGVAEIWGRKAGGGGGMRSLAEGQQSAVCLRAVSRGIARQVSANPSQGTTSHVVTLHRIASHGIASTSLRSSAQKRHGIRSDAGEPGVMLTCRSAVSTGRMVLSSEWWKGVPRCWVCHRNLRATLCDCPDEARP